jgi:hypothetical protein
MDDGSFVEVTHGGHDAVLEFLFGCDPDVAQDGAGELGEEALDQVQPGAVLGREGKFEAARRSVGELGFRLLGDVCGMIVEDQTDRQIGGIDQLEKRDELAAAVAVLDQGMDLAGDKVDAGQQADRAVALVLKLAREARVHARFGRHVRGGRCDCLNAGLLVIGDDRHRLARLVFLRRRRLLQDTHLAVDAQHLRHLGLELRVPAFEVVAHLVRLHLLRVEDLAHGALDQPAQARMLLPRPMLAGLPGQKPRRPNLVRIAQILRLPASQRHHPRLGLDRDRRLLAGAGTLIERYAIAPSALARSM